MKARTISPSTLVGTWFEGIVIDGEIKRPLVNKTRIVCRYRSKFTNPDGSHKIHEVVQYDEEKGYWDRDPENWKYPYGHYMSWVKQESDIFKALKDYIVKEVV